MFLKKNFLKVFFIIAFFLVSVPVQAQKASILSLRTGVHKDFHRIVIELSGKVGFKINRDGSTVSLQMRGTDSKYPLKTLPSTVLFEIKGLSSSTDAEGPFASLDVSVNDGARLKQSVLEAPFRIILDVYPEKENKRLPKKAANEAVIEKKPSAEKRPEAKALSNPDTAAERVVTFNDGWRWVYRKKATVLLREQVLNEPALRFSVFRNTLGLKGADRNEIVKEAAPLIHVLNEGGYTGDAKALQGIVDFFEKEKDPAALDSLLRGTPGNAFNGLGQFLLGSYYERIDFIPEADGYYSRVIREGKDEYLRSVALFSRGRLLFFGGKLVEAKVLFKKASEAGYKNAELWLADTLIIKGEFDAAWSIYGKNNDIPLELLDSVTLLSMGDMDISKGSFDTAREIFELLRSRHSKNEFLATFFALKAGDAYLAEGRRDEAVRTYTKVKEKLDSNEGWAIASLSLADAVALEGGKDLLLKAEKIYKMVANGDYKGSELAFLSLISARIGLEKYEEAMADAGRFRERFPTSNYRPDLQALEGAIVVKWIDDLYDKGDFQGVARVHSKYGSDVPFGKKAETFYKAGRAYFSLGLTGEAVNNLDKAAKMGGDVVAEKAMLELGRVYLSQKDTESTERLMDAFTARFPKSAHTEEFKRILLKKSFMKQDYEKVVSAITEPHDTEAMMLKANSLVRLNRHREAIPLFEKAARVFNENRDKPHLVGACMGIADSSYSVGRYPDAIEAYKKAIESMEGDKGQDRSWALYRMAQGYSKLRKNDEKKQALRELKGQNSEFGNLAEPILKETREGF